MPKVKTEGPVTTITTTPMDEWNILIAHFLKKCNAQCPHCYYDAVHKELTKDRQNNWL